MNSTLDLYGIGNELLLINVCSGRKKRSLSEDNSTENLMDYMDDEGEQRETSPQIDIREQLDDIWRHYLNRRADLTNRKVKL